MLTAAKGAGEINGVASGETERRKEVKRNGETRREKRRKKY